MERAHLKKPCQPAECPSEILRQLLEAQEQRMRSCRSVPGQEMAAPGSEIAPAGNDGIESDVVARGPQEFLQAAAAIAAVAHDIDRLSVVDRPFMSFDEREPEKICRELPVRSPLEMADLLRHGRVAKQIVRIHAPRLEAKAGPEDGAQVGVAAPRIRGEPDDIAGPHDGALFHHHGAAHLIRKTLCVQDVTQHWQTSLLRRTQAYGLAMRLRIWVAEISSDASSRAMRSIS